MYKADVRWSTLLELIQEICLCVISSRTSFFSYKKLVWIRTLFYSVWEAWSHVIEMLCCYWLDVLVVNADSTIVAATANHHLCHPTCFSYEKLRWLCMQLIHKFLVQFYRRRVFYEKLVPSVIIFSRLFLLMCHLFSDSDLSQSFRQDFLSSKVAIFYFSVSKFLSEIERLRFSKK